MTIIEAIKSGKPFRRKGEKNWYGNSPDAAKMFHIESMNVFCHYASIIADDWEVEEKKIEITHSQLLKAIAAVAKKECETLGDHHRVQILCGFAPHISKELGL